MYVQTLHAVCVCVYKHCLINLTAILAAMDEIGPLLDLQGRDVGRFPWRPAADQRLLEHSSHVLYLMFPPGGGGKHKCNTVFSLSFFLFHAHMR
jgi:hypothetical protein